MSASNELQIRTVLESVVHNGNEDSCFSFIIEHLSQAEKDRFGETLLRKILHPEDTAGDAIDDDTVQKLLGYKMKQHFVKFFKKHLKPDEYETFDFTQLCEMNNSCRREDNRGAQNLHKYMFRLKTVQRLTMLATTDAGIAAREYYLKLEGLIQTYGVQQMQRRIDDVETRHKPARLQHQEQGEHVYIFKDSHGTKVGRTSNMNQRSLAYRSMNPDGSMDHKISCFSSSALERTSHVILDQYHLERNTEWFNCAPELALEVVNASQTYMDGLAGYADGVVDFQLAERMTNLMKEYHEFLVLHNDKYGQRESHPAHIQHIRAGTRPTQLPLSKSLYGRGASVVTPSEIDTRHESMSFEDLRASQCDPGDFEKFVHDCLIVDPDGEVMSGQVTHVHRFWSKHCHKRDQDALLAYLDSKFKVGKSVYDAVIDGCIKVYFGLRLKHIVYDTSIHSEYDQFIAENFIVDCTARVMMTRLQDVYVRWKTKRGETLDARKSLWKDPLHKYMQSKFLFDAQVWVGDRGQQMGYRGVGLPGELIGVGLRTNKQKNGGKNVVLRHVNGGDIVRVFSQHGEAAKFVRRAPSLITTRLKDGKPIGPKGKETYTVHSWDDLTEEEKAMVKEAHARVTCDDLPEGGSSMSI